ncbi:hypothetical protein CDV36_000699 [Fusarium kuroshium]|uniref:NB-ARC domain-containing protein n=1 Tax=Fusarium kuroshium TaxID=2010991 RepID=A0A3M2SQ49_9HYPO|nr:hypothetical protein CDV36_000699 [Fusarium kuroshium]
MDVSENLGGIDQLHQLLLCFQCQRVPFDLISRACKPKSSWSATGEPEKIQPDEGGVPQWLLGLWETRQWPFSHADDAAAGVDGLRFVNNCGIQYLEIQASSPANSLEASDDEQSQEAYISQCIRIFNHAFPCRNTEVLGEEIAARLMPLAKAFVLPLLASASERQICHWLPPSERKVLFALTLFDCLLQVFTFLGPYSPLNPTNFPRKVLNAIDMPAAQGHGVEPCLKVFLGMIDTISSPSLESFERFALNSTSTDLDERSNAWTGLVLRMLLSSGRTKRSQPQALSDAILKAAASWNPKSTTHTSPIEYLVAIELLPHARLRSISLSESLTVSIELNIVRGLLLSRMQYHQEASRALYDILPSAISHWGLASFQVGIVGAESANCYNMLRKEDVANTIATRCLAARSTPELTSRQDWFYLSLHLVDSLIGRGRYAEAEPVVQHILSQPVVPPMIHMMACLRLSKIGRRAPGEFGTVFEEHHALQEGIGVFRQVTYALQEEFLEELACILSAKGATQKSLEAQKVLVDTINDLLGQRRSRKSPAQERYARAQLDFSQHFRRQNHDGMSEDETSLELPALSVDDDPCSQESISSHVIDDTIPIATQSVFSITYERDDDFVPIPAAFKLTHDPLLEDKIHLYSIYGQAGTGKTSLAADFTHKSRDHYSFILWIKDAPLEEILDYLSSVAARLGLKNTSSSVPIRPEQALEQMFRWFTHPRNASSRVPWLIVFDGIEREEVLRQLWPRGGRFGTVLVITRNKPYFLYHFDRDMPLYIELRGLTPESAIQWASRHTMATKSTLVNRTLSPRKEMASFAELLRYHPAAIKQATSLISRRHMGVGDFIAAYKKTRASIPEPLVMEILSQPNHSIQLITTWLLNPVDSGVLMNAISFLDPYGIPESLLWPSASFTWPDGYPQGVSEFEEMRDQLLKSSLIWRGNAQQTIYTSRAVQKIFIKRMDPPCFRRACCRVLFLLAYTWPCKFEDHLFIAYWTPPFTKCCNLTSHAFGLDYQLSHVSSSVKPELLILTNPRCAIKHGKYTSAGLFLILVSRILDVHISESHLPLPHTTLRHACLLNHHNGVLAYRRGQYDSAAYYFRRCFLKAVNDLGPGEGYWSIQAACHYGLGNIKRKEPSIPDSIASYEMSIKALEHIEGKSEQDVSFVKLNLGLSLLMNDEPKAAEKVLEQARLPEPVTNLEDDTSDSRQILVLCLGLPIAKLTQNKAEESLQLCLEYLAMLPLPTPVSISQPATGLHLIASGSYGRLSKFDLAQ